MTPDYDDVTVESQWLQEQRRHVAEYLAQESIRHGEIAEKPAWFVAPYVSIWTVYGVSADAPGLWVICGDLPADFLSAEDARDARQAMRVFVSRWRHLSDCMIRDELHPTLRIGRPQGQRELGELLQKRADTLQEWADDDSIWREIDNQS